jgi:uncharacterized iron-regulated membrane protein
MIFRFELERLCFPTLMHTHSEPGSVNFNACMKAARTVNVAKTVRSVRLPVQADDTLEWLTIPAGETTKVHATYVYADPFTCSVLGTRGPKKDVMSFLVGFHHTLFLAKTGAIIQIVLALATITLIVTGLILVAQNLDVVTRASSSQSPPAALHHRLLGVFAVTHHRANRRVHGMACGDHTGIAA